MKRLVAVFVLAAFMMGSVPVPASAQGFFQDTYGFFENLGKPSKAKVEKKAKEEKKTRKSTRKGSSYIK
ncbi:MAG: hypothetical protein PVH45_03100 [Candidatus Omnitrophota bacterium]|jgi:hypothetical protein